jgi:hypothetical protein
MYASQTWRLRKLEEKVGGGGVSWLRSLVAGLSPRRPGFVPGSIHVGFVVDKVAIYHSTVALQTHIIWGMRNMLT